MEGYIDMHTHILPGVDDGAQNEEQSKTMLQIAYREGVRSIMATPHFYPGRERCSTEQIKENYEKTKSIAQKLGIQLYLGNEIIYERGVVEALEKKEALTLADSSYVLIEFFLEQTYADIYCGLRGLVESGYLPIVAHIERYSVLLEKEEHLQELIEMGCMIQMNTRSVIGGMMDGRARQCQKLIRKGYIHFFGSDCHNETSRPPMMKTPLEFLKKKKIPQEIIQKIVWENPQKVIRRIV